MLGWQVIGLLDVSWQGPICRRRRRVGLDELYVGKTRAKPESDRFRNLRFADRSGMEPNQGFSGPMLPSPFGPATHGPEPAGAAEGEFPRRQRGELKQRCSESVRTIHSDSQAVWRWGGAAATGVSVQRRRGWWMGVLWLQPNI